MEKTRAIPSIILLLTALLPSTATRAAETTTAAESRPWRIDASLAAALIAEQAKNSSGDSGGRLFQDAQLGLLLSGSRQALDWLDVGAFLMAEHGVRSASQFGGVGPDGVPTTISRSGGSYSFFWVGPLARARWRALFLEAGYIAFGVRHDGALGGLVTRSGGNSADLRTDPLRAWLFAGGATVPLTDRLGLTLRVEYRFTYYNRRGGERLNHDLLYGTQAIRPHVGLAYSL